MKKYFNILAHLSVGVTMFCLMGGMVSMNMYEMYNAYSPYNAMAAEPARPYSPKMVPKISRTYYRPLPVCAPTWLLFPDSPPITQSVRAPFQIPVPTP
jgi:hypothetical protein